MKNSENSKKAAKYLLNIIRHDFGFYNPIWKWSELPSPLKESFSLIEPKLNQWEKQGHIRIFEENGERMIEIYSVPEN